MTDGYEVGYDADGNVQVVAASAPEKAPEDLQMLDMSSPMTFELPSAPEKAPEAVKETALEGGCSAGTDKMEAAARAGGRWGQRGRRRRRQDAAVTTWRRAAV